MAQSKVDGARRMNGREGSMFGLMVQDVAAEDSWVYFGAVTDQITYEIDFQVRATAMLLGVAEPDIITDAYGAYGYFRINRTGNVWTFYHKAEEVDAWTTIGTYTLALGTSTRVGLCVSAPDLGKGGHVRGTFEYIRFTAGGLATCARTIEDCRLHHQEHRIFAFPGMPQNR